MSVEWEPSSCCHAPVTQNFTLVVYCLPQLAFPPVFSLLDLSELKSIALVHISS